MNLCDLKIGDAITVKASHGLDCIEFQSTIAGSVDGIAVMNPVISSSKPVNFVSDFVKTDILYEASNSATYIFKNVHILNEKGMSGKLMSFIHCRDEGILLNRRETKRFVVNEVCVFSPGPHRAAVNAMIRDISMNGVCIVSTLVASVGSIGRFSFIPEKVKGLGNISEEIEICRVVNDPESDRVMCGCKFTSHNNMINKYVAAYQRQLLKDKANPS